MAEPRSTAINPFYLDSATALRGIRGGPQMTEGSLPDFGGTMTAAPAPAAQAAPVPAPAAPQTAPRSGGLSFQEGDLPDFGRAPASPVLQSAPAAAAPAPVKEEEEGFLTGLWKSVSGGAQDTAGSLSATGSVITGNNQGVVDTATAARERRKDEAQALSAFKGDIAKRQSADDDSLWSGIKNVVGAAYENPEGAFQMVVSQLPNTAVSLGAGFAGAKTGLAVGALTGPAAPVAAPVLGVAGFLTGLFAANTALEVGGKAQEKAGDGVFTDQERGEAAAEGTKKGAVITAVDAVTLGGSKWILGAANRAVETATVRSLQNAGVDTTAAVARIKDAQKAALEATAPLGREASTAAMEKATFEAMVREGLTDPAVMQTVRTAQQTALESVNALGKRLGRGTAAVGLESVGEGLGEYLGEYAATGKASPTEAVLEALSGLSMSVGELAGLAKIDRPGELTRITNTAGVLDQRNTSAPGATTTTGPLGGAGIEALNPNATDVDDIRASNSANRIEGALKKNRQDTLSVMAAIYNTESEFVEDNQPNPARQALDVAAQRAGVIDDFNAAKQNNGMIESGMQLMSDFPKLRNDFLGSVIDYASTMPPPGRTKRDRRGQQQPQTPTMSEEDVMNMPIPDEVAAGSSGEPVATGVLDSQIAAVRASENPGQTAAQNIQSSAYSTDEKAIEGWKSNAKDKYGVVAHDAPDGSTRVFTHDALPGVSFRSRDDLFNAFKLLDAANETAKVRRNAKMAEMTQPAEQVDESEENPMDLLDEPADQATPPQPSRVDLAKEDVKDALFNLWDVASDASGTKMNIGGQRYTTKDLPKALRQVMEALVKLGYVKFADITEKLLERMKASENWKHLVDKVTPAMLRQAYSSLPDFDGKENLDAKAEAPKRTVSDVIKALPAVVKNIIETGESKNPNDMEVLVKRRMKQNPEWRDLADKVTTGMVRQAYAKAVGSMSQQDESEATGTFKRGKTISAAEVANRKLDESREPPADEAPVVERRGTEIEQKRSDLVTEIRRIYTQATQGSFYQNLLGNLHKQIDELENRIRGLNRMEVTNPDGSVTVFYRRTDGETTMERQLESTGRQDRPDGYYELTNDATFDNPDSKAALLAKKRMLELEVRYLQQAKVSKQAALGKLGLKQIRRQIDDAIQAAVKNGLPIEETIDIGREWIAGIDNYLNLGKIAKAEKNAQVAADLQELVDSLNRSAEEATLPSDSEFSFGITSDLRNRKVKLEEAIALIDEAGRRGELTSKRKVVSAVLSDMIGDFGLLNTQGKGEQKLNDILAFSSKYKKEGLLRFDDFADLFHANNMDVPHEVVKTGEIAASKGLLDFMAEHKFDPTMRYNWLRSMDRVVRFNPALLKSPQFTDLERDLYSEWKQQVGAINRRTQRQGETASIKEDFPDLLFNKYTLDQMRDPSSLPLNERTRLKELYPNLVDAYFTDMRFAVRNGYPMADVMDSLTGEDRTAFIDWVKQQRKSDKEMADRMERQKYFAMLSQFRHIGDETFADLHRMMREDAIANLPMIYDMAANIERQAIEGRNVNPDTGEVTPLPTSRDRANERTPEEQRFYEEQFANAEQDPDDQALSDMVGSALVRSVMGETGVSDATLRGRRDPMLDFSAYRDAVESRLTSYNENAGDQNRASDDDTVEDMIARGDDVELANLLGLDPIDQENTDEEGGDNARLRQGQYVGFLSTGIVMQYISQITKNWTNAPNIVVLQNHMQLPEGIREEVSRKLERGMGAKGMFDPSTGTVYLFSNFLSSRADVQFTLFHEAYGHLGLRLVFGQDFDTFLSNMYNANEAVRTEADRRIKQGGIGKLEAVEEVLSDMAGDGRESGAVKDFIGKIISGLRRIGLDKVANFMGKMTDAELSYSLKMARQYAEDSAGHSPLMSGTRDIRLSEERPPYEIFATKDGKTTAFARYDPLNDQWYLFVGKGGKDIRIDSDVYVHDDLGKLIDVMQRYGKLERRRRSGFFRDNTVPADFVKFINSQQVGKFRRALDTVIRSLQNQYLPVFRLVEQMEKLGRAAGALDLRKYLRTTERQTAVMVEDFNKDYVTPILDLLRDAEKAGGNFGFGATNMYSMLNKFLLAQTADERNRQVNKRNPTMLDGSGMDSETAQQILDFVATQQYGDTFQKIGDMLDKLSERKIEWEVKTGLITRKEGDQRLAAYQHYRNLSGVNTDLDPDFTGDPSLNIGRKFNLRGKDKYALGRSDEAPDILARTLVAAEASIIRGNKNKIAQRILMFFETNYDPNLVTINEQSKVKKLGSDGFVQLVDNEMYYNQPDVFIAKVKGIPVTIRFKDAGYTSIAEAIHGKVEPQSEHPIRHITGLWTRFAGEMITKYNPFWIPVNFVRDVQTLFLNAAVNAQVGTGAAKQMFKALLPAMGTTIRIAIMDMRPTTKAGKAAQQSILALMGKPNEELMEMYEEGRRAGAFTSFINHKNLEDQIIQINEALSGKSAIGRLEGLVKFWDVVTIPVEMAPRLAAYSVMRKNGWEAIDAADYAGSVTVDFNMRGTNEAVRAAYLFFNPAVQGTAQMVKLARENPKRFGIAAGGLFMLGFLSSALTRMGGDDDDEERKRDERGLSVLDEIPTYKRATSLIFAPDTRGGAMPIAYGWNAPFAAGVFMADSVFGNVPWSVSLKRTIQAAIESYSPVGGSGFDIFKAGSEPVKQAILLLAPTYAAPLAQWELNQNRWGGPLYPNSDFSGREGMSDTTKAFDSVNPISRWLTETLQEVTGGDRRNQKGIDVSPALIDHLFQSYVPGLATEAYKGAGVAIRKAQGLDTPRDKEPLFDRFSAYPGESFDASAFRRVEQKVSALYRELEDHPMGDARFQQIMKEHPGLGRMKAGLTVINTELRGLRSDLREVEQSIYIIRKDGQIARAEQMEKDAVRLRNETKKAEKKLFEKFVTLATQHGFREYIYED